MNKAVLLLMFAALVMASGSAGVMAADKVAAKSAGKKSSSYVSGILSVTKNDKGGVEAIAITTKSSSVYNIDMDGFSQDCSSQDGKEVKAYGEVKEVDGKLVLKVNGKIMRVGGDKQDKKEKKEKESVQAGKKK